MTTIEELVADYQGWLRDRTVLKSVGEWTEITTPYLDRHNDYVQVYCKREPNGFLLTDDGQTINDLEASGCQLDSPRRKNLMKTMLNGFGVQLEGFELCVRATNETFPLRKHSLIQAILAVNDMFALAPPITKSLFKEDVQEWFDLMEIRYLPNIRLPGASGFDHVFDFAIPKSKLQPERLLRAIDNPNRDRVESFAFAWHDTRGSRSQNAIAYAILNDTDREIAQTVTDPFRAYDINPLLFSHRQQFGESLAA